MKQRILILLIAVLALLPARGLAQVVQGKVLDSSGTPVRGAFVALLSGEGKQLGAVLAGDGGDFVFRVSPGKYALKVEQIGHQTTMVPVFEVAVGRSFSQDIRMEIAALRIREISVSAGNRCSARPDGSAQTAAVWNEVRKALSVAMWMEGAGSATFRVKAYERDVDLEMKDVRPPTTEFGSRAGRNAYVAANPDSLINNGFMQQRSDGAWLFGPDANVLLSNSFLAVHCFRLERRRDRPGQIGLAFEPVAGRRVPDIAGTMWLDENTARLRHVEYVYKNVPNYEDPRYSGGRTEFEQLPNGAWIVRRWNVRSPRLGRVQNTTDLRVIGMRESGGEVLDVQIAGLGTTTIVARHAISGIVFDSVNMRPLPGARVYLSGTPFTVLAGQNGRFQFDSIPAGEYLLAFTHPRLDSLPRYPEPVRIAAQGNLTDLVVATPSAQQIANSLCSSEEWARAAKLSQDTSSANRGVIFGTVGRTSGAYDEIMIEAHWARITYSGPGTMLRTDHMSDLKQSGYGFGVMTDEAGFYALCRLPVDRPLLLEVRMRDRVLARDTLRMHPTGLLRRDLRLSTSSQ
jgi:hypothetical protein